MSIKEGIVRLVNKTEGLIQFNGISILKGKFAEISTEVHKEWEAIIHSLGLTVEFPQPEAEKKAVDDAAAKAAADKAAKDKAAADKKAADAKAAADKKAADEAAAKAQATTPPAADAEKK